MLTKTPAKNAFCTKKHFGVMPTPSTKDMKDLEKSDPKMAADVQKEFAKERMQAAATEKKLKFGIQAFRKTLESRSGERADKVKKMM